MSNLKLDFSRGEILAKKYEVVDLLDESPLGLTYRVKHLKSGKYVRLLLLRPNIAGHEQKDAVVAAFKGAKELQHANLIKIGELGDHEGVAYVTMEDFEGQTLREVLQEYKVSGKQFQLRQASQISIQILEALGAAHEQGIVFRALRPEYVLINVRYTGPRKQNFVAQVKLIGAGFWDLVPAGTLAEDEFTRGEAQYLAPELKSFEPEPTARCDGYSTAVMFYEMLTGTAPVGTFQLPTLLRQDLPKQVNGVVELALAVAPEDRYQSARDFVADIQRMISETSVAGAGEVEKKPLITPFGWALMVLLAVAVVVIAYQLFAPGDVNEGKVADSLLRQSVKEAHEAPSPEAVKEILAKHPPNMIYVPGGPMIQGRMHEDIHSMTAEPLARKVEVRGFLIDAFEYPNKMKGKPEFNVTYEKADQMCAEQGKRLCTETEWEKACKGPMNSIYAYNTLGPVADQYDQEFCGAGLEDRGLSGSRPDCRAKWLGGPFDMSGNFREWTSTSPPNNDDRRIVKGGMREHPERGTRCAFRTDEGMTFTDGSMSFRCCRNLDAPAWVPPAEEGEGEGEGEETE